MKVQVIKTKRFITVNWDAVNCVWRDINHRGVYYTEELKFKSNE